MLKFLALHLFISSALFSAVAAAQTPTIEVKDAGLKNESEIAIVLANGNSRSDSYNIKQQTGYLSDGNTFKAQYRNLRTRSFGVESAENWDAALRYERFLGANISGYAGESVESDRFAGFHTRTSSEVGAKYAILKTEELSWNSELGYRYSDERRVAAPNVWSHYARVYTDVEYRFNPTSALKFWVEYFPNFTRSQEYLINSEASVSTVLTSILSLKTGFLLKFNNQPPPGVAETTDTLFTTSLVAKF